MGYKRYTIHTELAANISGHPNRFDVKVSRVGLAKLLLRELVHARGNLEVVTSRPCMYGVFSGPVGGFLPRPQHCVGCLRCMVQYPDIVQVLHGKDRLELGDGYFDPDKVDAVIYEASTGRIPVRGAGYGGPFGGEGWDGMWTDMSEIVRPTRDGIHGREFISTDIDLGSKPLYLTFDTDGNLEGNHARWVSLSIPYLLDFPSGFPNPAKIAKMLQKAAIELNTRLILPLQLAMDHNMGGEGLIPILHPRDSSRLKDLGAVPDVVELTEWEADVVKRLREEWPELVIGVRGPFGTDVVSLVHAGIDFIHLMADYHGGTSKGFILESIRQAHLELVEEGIRECVSLIGSGGMVTAEHVPKAIICGLDAVALDTPLLIALQGQFLGEMQTREHGRVELPEFPERWGVQRILNLIGSWRDQLFEILGAMGMREVRRLRGEIGRAMFQKDLEQETFAEMEGFRGQRIDE
jgi:hypothetical protein